MWSFPRPCRFVVERVCVLAGEFAVGEALATDLRHGESEALRVVHVLAVVVAETLFVKVAVKMKRLYAHVGSRNPALKQRPEILKAVRVYATVYVLNRMVNNLVCVVALKGGKVTAKKLTPNSAQTPPARLHRPAGQRTKESST